jgi:exodeoxyribonuclease V alpha subunit
MIIRAAHIINSGGYLNIPDTEDMVFRRVEAPEDIRRIILNEVRDIESTQVLSPMKKGVIGTVELNRAIRGLFFEDSGESTRIPFKKGDRVIQRHNNYEKGVFNGEIGFVRDIDEEENTIFVTFDDREVFYEDFEFDDLDFAYALTVHKSQGSEYDTVIIPVSTSHYVMLFRNLLYTAITRARRRVVLVGTDMAVNIAIRNNKPINRFTSLGQLC